MFSDNNKFKIKIIEINIESSPQEKLLGVISDDQLSFKTHMSNLCKKASQSDALARTSSFIDLFFLNILRDIAFYMRHFYN